MIENIILYSILGVAGLMVLAFLTKATGKIVSADATGRYNLRMNKLYGIMGGVALIFGLLFLIFLPLTAEQIDSGLIISVLLMLIIFGEQVFHVYCTIKTIDFHLMTSQSM